MKIGLKKIKKFIRLLQRDIILLWLTPIEFLYSYSYPNDKYVLISPYDPKITQIGKKLIKVINKIYPELKIHLIGSAALKIYGQRDLDFIADCPSHKINHYFSGLTSILGEPKKTKHDFIEWEIEIRSIHVDFLLIDPKHPVSIETLKVYRLLKNNQNILKQYEQIKKSSNGLSIREYKRKRLEFFNKIELQAHEDSNLK